MIASSIGMFTTVDLNNAAASYYWRGEKLGHVISCLAIHSGKQKRVSLRVLDPARVQPALDADERKRLNSVYAEMQAADIIILKSKGA